MSRLRLIEIPVIFYRTSGRAGNRVAAYAAAGSPAVIGTDLATMQWGWPVGMPLCRPLGQGFWEVRSTLPSRRVARLLFFVHGDRIGVVHGFIKKTQKTPADDLELARAAHEGDAGMSGKKNPHWGTSLDEFLAKEGIREAAKAEALTRVIAWQLNEEMERQGITKAVLAERMHTSRAQVDRILKAKGNVTIESLQRAAALVGRELRLELV